MCHLVQKSYILSMAVSMLNSLEMPYNIIFPLSAREVKGIHDKSCWLGFLVIKVFLVIQINFMHILQRHTLYIAACSMYDNV